MYTQLAPSRIVIRIVACCGGRRPPLRLFVCTDSLSSTAYCCRFAFLRLRVESVSEAQVGGVFHLWSVRIVYLARVLVADHAEREHDAALPTAVEHEAARAVGLR